MSENPSLLGNVEEE